MLQLTQSLKFETFDDSALSRFLLRRAISNPTNVGHSLFWHLQAELHNVEFKQRFLIILNIFLKSCGAYRIDLGHQLLLMKKLQEVSNAISRCLTKEERLITLKKRLNKIEFPSSFQLPLNPKIRVCGVILDECK